MNVKDGPIVVEIPPGVLGPVDDAFFRFVTDIGLTGPDQGKGGKYLFVHRDYKGAIPEGYFRRQDADLSQPVLLPRLRERRRSRGTADAVKAKFRMYPLAQAANPPEQRSSTSPASSSTPSMRTTSSSSKS